MAATPPSQRRHIGVAVSGGGDSMALMLLAANWGRTQGITIDVASVDHRLRPEAADEVAMVAAQANTLGLHHTALHWQHEDQGRDIQANHQSTLQGNLQNNARQARRSLLADWASARGISHILLGHTLDDQAETVLMRLARGSGVDGLAGMAPVTQAQGHIWLRPLLGMRRVELRQYLTANATPWADDPSNDDPKYDRIKARQAMDTLAPLGLTAERLAQTANHMQFARQTLQLATQDLATQIATQQAGDVVLDLPALQRAPREVMTRLLSAALNWVSGHNYRPRYQALTDTVHRLAQGHDCTLHGCHLLVKSSTLHICREANAVKDLRTPATEQPDNTPNQHPTPCWDGRWQASGPTLAGLEIAMLGDAGLAQCPDWRESGLPRQSLLSSPALWRHHQLIAAPLAQLPGKYAIFLCPRRQDFNLWLLSH